MEDRIKRMESAIISSGLQGPAGLVDAKEEEEEEGGEKTSSDKIESQAKLSNQLANLVIDSNGSTNFIGMYRSQYMHPCTDHRTQDRPLDFHFSLPLASGGLRKRWVTRMS